MSQLPLSQISFISPLINHLKYIGIKTDPLLRKVGLSNYNLEDTSAYVPLNLVYNFLDLLEKQIGINDFVSFFHKVIKLESFPVLGELIISSPNVYSSCLYVEEYNKIGL